MSADDEDKATVVLDLNALRKQKLNQEEELASLVQDLEFTVGAEEQAPLASVEANKNLNHSRPTVILFDFQSDYFHKSIKIFPEGYKYQIINSLAELNNLLGPEKAQIVVFNYDVNPKAVNQLTAQIKKKFQSTKTIIMARSISPEKAKIHACTASGAHGYYQFPLETHKIELEFSKVCLKMKNAG